MSIALAAHGRADPIDRSWWVSPPAVSGWLVARANDLRCSVWYFNFDYHYMNAGICGGTGWAMVFLALVLAIRMPSIAIFLLGLALMIGHPLLASLLGNSWWWTLLLHSG